MPTLASPLNKQRGGGGGGGGGALKEETESCTLNNQDVCRTLLCCVGGVAYRPVDDKPEPAGVAI